MAATSARRMTEDADIATVGVANEEAGIATVLRAIIAVAVDDELAFDETTIRTELMREDAEYHGVRVKLEAILSTARITTVGFTVKATRPPSVSADPCGFLARRAVATR